MLPEQIETLESAKARFRKALEKCWNLRAIAKNPKGDRPGIHREHVFDFETGIRMIASHEHDHGKKFFHVSFSCNERVQSAGRFRFLVDELLFSFFGPYKQMMQPRASKNAIHFWYLPHP